MSAKIRIIVAKNNKESLNAIKQLLASFNNVKVIGESNSSTDVIDMAIKFHPDIVIMDFNIASSDTLEICKKINQAVPYIGIIFIGSIEGLNVIRLAMQSGASDFLELPITSSKLYNSITTIYKIKQEQKKQLIKNSLVIPEKSSKIISVFSSKGGVGKTVLATNVAIGLSHQTREEVLLMDMDLQFGDVADMLDIVPKTSVVDLVTNVDTNEVTELYKYMIPHSSGIRILPAPHDAEQADQITNNDLKTLFPMIIKIFDYIVVDLPPIFNQTTLATIEASDYLLLLTTMEIPTLKNVKESLDILRKIGFSEEKVFIVINRYYKNSDIRILDIQKFLGIQRNFCISDSPDIVSASINSGDPIVLKYKNSDIATEIIKLCNALINYGDTLDNNTKNSLLKRILKRVNDKDE